MEVTELVRTLLGKRGISNTDDVDRFLTPDYVRDTHNPFLLEGMERAVARMFAAMEQKQKIAVYADFDCDGIPGAALLSDFFTKIGYTDISVYIPHRDREGYGFHIEAIEKLAQQGVALIITVDVGTTAIDAVKRAKELGVDVIVTDHHEPDPIREPLASNGAGAVAVINPKNGPSTGSGQVSYPFRDLCGAAVAWKLVCALLVEGRKRGLPQFAAIPEGWEKWLLDLVAIATVADLVPLVGENRALTHFGLKVLRKSRRLGMKALCSRARVRQADITEDDIAFSFAPRINAASRMDEPEEAFRLLTTTNGDEAEKCAAHLESLNTKRRSVVGVVVREAKSRIKARFNAQDRVVVLGDTAWKPALMGLAANSIMGERGGIVCMWGRDANGRLKGSCRSDGSVSVVELFTRARVSFEEFGGHHASGGFSVSHESVHTLPEVLAREAEALQSGPSPIRSEPDAELSLKQVSTALLKELSQMAPFGIGNPKPLFRVRKTRITFAKQFGKDMNHTEVMLVCPESGAQCRAFQFFKTPLDFSVAPSPDTLVDVLATIERDTFRGPDRLALRLADIVAPRE